MLNQLLIETNQQKDETILKLEQETQKIRNDLIRLELSASEKETENN